ncbi:MAG: hypothetical protein OEV00_09325 [Acidobacteriota bacterium]|nr:hypothetical protein [Acidobacteriota bacterium]MDH3785511.1 hypothetical protein [Acidobacteriota bacterium]
MSQDSPIETLVNGILDGTAAAHLRTAAARGALPLPRPTLVRLFIALSEDNDEEVKSAAAASLGALTNEETRTVLADADCPPQVLVHFATQASRAIDLAEPIAFHPAVPDAALAILAAGGNADVCQLVLTNEERLLARPMLLERLMLNPAISAGQRGRILEFLERASDLAEKAREEAGDAPETPEGDENLDVDDVETMARLLDVDVGELMSVSEIMGAEELEQSDDPQIRSTFSKIVTLSAAHKAILAMKGGREERSILIRDTNKVVSLGVLKNPRLSDTEIETIAQMRNVSEDVLRMVGGSREWIKSYTVIKSLINNPKTPQSVSMNFVSRLQNKDLRDLARSREVPQLIRRMAKRTFDTRTQQQGNKLRKK